jgi:Na+/glutamate symporter
MIKSALVSFLLATALMVIQVHANEVSAVPMGINTLTTQQVVQDLTYFRDTWSKMDRSYTAETRRQMFAFIDQRISTAHHYGQSRTCTHF